MAEVRRAEATWFGDLVAGSGVVSAATSGKFRDLGVTWADRTQESSGKTSPEELLAASHAACFSMALEMVAKASSTSGRFLRASGMVM